MKRRTLVAVVGLTLGSLLAADAADVWARAGRGGSRGSRSYSAPARPSPSSAMTPSSPSRSLNQPSSPAAPQRPGFFGGGMMGAARHILPRVAALAQQAVPFPPEVTAARFIHDAPLLGALALALEAAG